MAATHKHLRSSTAHKRPTTAIAEGQIALATNSASPGLFFKDSTGATIIKIGPVHVGATAPNSAPAGSAGNSTGEIWLDTSLTPIGVKIYDGSTFVNATPIGSTTVQGLLELATNAETQAGVDSIRAITSAGLQSKLSDSISTTSSTTIASATAVKSAYDLANAALPKTGGTFTGNLEIGTTGSLSFEGATADAFETTIAVVDPTADRTITLPDTTGTIVTTGDTGTITSTMLLDGTILNADVNASAAIAGTKISPDFGSQNITTTGTNTAASFIPTSGTVPTNGLYLSAANSVAISTNSTGRLTIDSSGNINIDSGTVYVDAVNNRLGIGTSIPGALVDVSGSGNIVRLGDGTNTFDVRFKGPNNWAVQLDTPADNFTVQRNGVGFVTINGAGRVGIGTTSPGEKLHVAGDGVRIDRTSGDPYIDFYTSGSANNVMLYGGASTGFRVFVGGSERTRVDSSGRLLVGTSTSPTGGGYNQYAKLVTQGNTAGAGAGLCALNRGENASSITIDEEIGAISFGDSAGNEFATIVCRADATAGSNDYPGRLVFSTTADGASSPTERMKITSSGNVNITNGNLVFSTAGTGIDFSATANSSGTTTSELLSDYEEGTWTPTIIGFSTAGTVSYSNRNARYTKIGRQVFVETYISWSGGIGGSGNLNVSGLPFTTANVDIYPALSIGYWDSIAFSGSQVLALFANAATYIYFYGVPTNGGTNTTVPWDSAGSMILSGSYTI